MTPEQWRRVREVVERALDAPPAERDAIVESACGGDQELLDEARSLLAAEPAADTVTRALRAAVEAGRQDLAAPAPRPSPVVELRAGQRIGAYEIEHELGRGGMGIVYLGRRADRSYEGRVAIKLLSRPADEGGELVRRFRQERQILARLDHPHIARLLDAGATPAGQLYLVMEHVEGRAIDDWCDERRLGVDERLHLFRQVVEAVHAAHRSLVVHRDLKPANVLVSPDGVPKLLDFGIAKLLDAEGFPHAAETTLLDARPMTPAHAAPEQMRGEPVTTATDVYGLGVTLYRLLTGALPYPDGTPLHRSILDAEPIPASVRVSGDGVEEAAAARGTDPARLRRRLGGDLDTILATALAKEPERRYGSAEAFAADLDRHLRGLPVAARRPTLPYRLAKAARRNRVATGLAALLTVALLGFGASMGVLAGRLAEERDRVAAERDRAVRQEREARQTADLLRELFSSADPDRAMGEAVTARELLDRGAERLDRELAGQPEIRASLLGTIASAYQGLGLYERAAPHVERSLALRREALGTSHPETLESLVQRGWNLRFRGRMEAALRAFNEAAERAERVLGPDADLVADALEGRADVEKATGDIRAAEASFDRSLAIRRLRPADEEELARSLLGLAWIRAEAGRAEEAEPLFREARDALGRVVGEDHPITLQARKGIANSLRARERHAEAEAEYRRLLAAERRVLGPEHPRIPYTLVGLGYAVAAQGRPVEAEAHFRESLRIRRTALGDDHPAIPISLAGIAFALNAQGRPEEAEVHYRETLARARRAFPPGFPGLAYPLVDLGTLLTENGNPDEAEPLLVEAVELRRRVLGAEDELTARAEEALAACRAALGRPAGPG